MIIPLLWFGLILSVLILVHEFGHFVIAKRLGVRVECFSLGFGPRLFWWKRGETEYRLSLVPLGGYVKMAGETAETPRSGEPWEYLSKPVWARGAIVLAGPLVNYGMAFFLFFLIFATGSPQVSNKIGEVLKDFPAEKAGLKRGDRIVAVKGQQTPSWEEVKRLISNHGEEGMLLLEVERGGRSFSLSVEPKRIEQKDLFGDLQKSAVIGIHPSEEISSLRYPIPQALEMASHQLISLTALTLKALARLVTGGLPMRDSLTGPIGIFFITRQAVSLGLASVLQVCGVLSASLAIFNLLPIPVLDGGHLLFLWVEALRRRPVSERIQEISRQLGFYFLMGLMLVVFYNDVVRWLGGSP